MEIVDHYKIEIIEEGTIQVEGDGWTMTDVPYEITALWEGRNVTYLEDSIKLKPDQDHLFEAGLNEAGLNAGLLEVRRAIRKKLEVRSAIRKEVYKRHCKKADELNAIMPPMHFFRELAEHEASVGRRRNDVTSISSRS